MIELSTDAIISAFNQVPQLYHTDTYIVIYHTDIYIYMYLVVINVNDRQPTDICS